VLHRKLLGVTVESMTQVRRAGRLLAGLLGLAGLLMVLVTTSPVVVWWARWLAGAWDDPHGEILVVLAGSVLSDGTLGESSYWRSVYAVRAFREGGFRRVIVSGGGNAPVPAAESMRNFVECMGIPPAAIELETRSNSTRESAQQTRRLLEGVPGRKVLLTSDYHMFRARRAFAKTGLDVIPRPFPDVIKRAQGWKGRWPCFLELLEETCKIGYYYARGWI